MNFNRVRELREDRDQTQQQIADMLNCNVTVYRRYELGIREIPVSMLIKLAQYYGVSLDYIAGQTDEKTCKKSPF